MLPQAPTQAIEIQLHHVYPSSYAVTAAYDQIITQANREMISGSSQLRHTRLQNIRRRYSTGSPAGFHIIRTIHEVHALMPG